MDKLLQKFNIKSGENKNKSAYSLLEMMVTLVIFGVLMMMLIEVLILSLDASRRIATRTRIRTEVAELTSLMRRDLRNASKIDEDNCGEILADFPDQTGCLVTVEGKKFLWVFGNGSNGCEDQKICKFEEDAGVYELLYTSSDLLLFDPDLTKFELQTYASNTNKTEGLLLVTLRADAINPQWEVSAQFRQIAIATRNF